MKKVKRFILNDSTLQLSTSQMQELKGGDSNNYVWSACSCNYASAIWFEYCYIDLLAKDQYRASCGDVPYYRCAAAVW